MPDLLSPISMETEQKKMQYNGTEDNYAKYM